MDFLKTLVASALLAASLAHAQYSSSALTVGPTSGVSLGSARVHAGLLIEYARYLEHGFELFGRAPILLTQVPAGADTPTGKGWVFATGLSLGARYLFAEEALRPWVGAHVGTSILVTTPGVSWFVGPGAGAGLEWVLSESFALGARATWDLFIRLNEPWMSQLGGALTLTILL